MKISTAKGNNSFANYNGGEGINREYEMRALDPPPEIGCFLFAPRTSRINAPGSQPPSLPAPTPSLHPLISPRGPYFRKY